MTIIIITIESNPTIAYLLPLTWAPHRIPLLDTWKCVHAHASEERIPYVNEESVPDVYEERFPA